MTRTLWLAAALAILGVTANGQEATAYARNIRTSVNLEASAGATPYDTINITIDAVLSNSKGGVMFVSPKSLQPTFVERLLDSGEWKTVLIMDTFDAKDPEYPPCVSLGPSATVTIPEVWSDVVLPKAEKKENREVRLRLHFLSRCRSNGTLISLPIVTEPIAIRRDE